MHFHRLLVSVTLALAALAAGDTAGVPQAAGRVEQQAARTSPALAAGFRAMAAAALQHRYPDLARKFEDAKRESPRPTTPTGARELGSRVTSIRQRISQMRGLPTDADRARLAIAVAADIRALPADPNKLAMAQNICSLATEGDLGMEALSAVAGALAQALHETPGTAGAYLELASLVRYEHVPAPPPDPALDAADAVLDLRRALDQENDFTLAALDGKSYTLSALRGRVVLLNFWATWCPPCRKEMPDMDKLYRELAQKGLTVLAVSDEKRDVVEGFLQKQSYTFPVLLDPGRKVHTDFGVESIPKSFLFDRQGKLVAQAIDMRTERQFREMLKSAGL